MTTRYAVARHAGYLVFEAEAHCPSVAPVVEREAIQQSRVAAGRLDLCTRPSGLAIKQPLIRGDAEAACHGRDGVNFGVEGHGRVEDAVEVFFQVGAAQGGFHAQHDISDLLIVADLAAAYEPARTVVEPFAGKADIGPVNLTPGPADVAADVKARPIHNGRNRISSPRSIPVCQCRSGAEPGGESDGRT